MSAPPLHLDFVAPPVYRWRRWCWAALALMVVLLATGRIHSSGPAAEIMQPALLSEIYGCHVREIRDGGQRALISLPLPSAG